MVYLLRDPIRENVAVEVSQVASRSLEHEQVAVKAEEFAKSLLQTLLHDENMHRLAAQFIKEVCILQISKITLSHVFLWPS